jgi:hypothetical protein
MHHVEHQHDKRNDRTANEKPSGNEFRTHRCECSKNNGCREAGEENSVQEPCEARLIKIAIEDGRLEECSDAVKQRRCFSTLLNIPDEGKTGARNIQKNYCCGNSRKAKKEGNISGRPPP